MDIRTLMVVQVLSCSMLALFLLVAARVQRPYPGFYYWALSCLAMSAAYASMALRGLVPLWLSVAATNLFLPLASVLRLVGLKKFFGRPPQYGLFWLAAVIPLLLNALVAAGYDDLQRALPVTLYLDLFIALTVRELWLARDRVNAPLHLAMIAVYALSGLTLTARYLDWRFNHEGSILLSSAPLNSGFFLLQIVVEVAWVTFFFAINVLRKSGELRLANQELEEAHRVKDRFLRVLGHDLRGPLGGLTAALETYVEERARLPEGERLKLLTMFLERSRGLSAQLESLLAWGRHQAGRADFAPERLRPFDLAERELLELENGKGVVFSNDIDPDAELEADPRQLALLLRNLLANALKFSNPGGEVRLALADGPDGARLTVEDRGIGIPEKDLSGIFILGGVPARQGTAREAGAGLGLPLCAQVAARHGGSLKAENRPGGGAVFTLFLPRAGAQSNR